MRELFNLIAFDKNFREKQVWQAIYQPHKLDNLLDVF